MSITIQVFSDYVCPFSYLGEVALRAAAARTGAEIVPRAWLPGESGAPNLDPQGEAMSRAWRETLSPMAERLGRAMRRPTRLPATRLAHEAAAWAGARHAFDAYRQRLFQAYFQEDRDIGEIGVLKEIAFQLGLNPDDLAASLHEQRMADEVDEDLMIGRTYGVTGAPTFVLGGHLLSGIQEEATLVRAIEAVRSGKADEERRKLRRLPIGITRR
ncbi:MAG: DsbA family protein [Blastocatellia bacterium]|nr:DsbA family protein [Blastocatellia bacterium]